MRLYGVAVAATDPATGFDLISHLYAMWFLYDKDQQPKRPSYFHVDRDKITKEPFYAVLFKQRYIAQIVFESLQDNPRFKSLDMIVYAEVAKKKKAALV